MDQQNNPDPKRVPTEAEIARLEAEAVRRQAGTGDGEEQPAGRVFVPYVDDVPAAPPKPAQAAEADAPEDDDEDDGEYIPSEWEKRIDRLTPAQWKRWQIIGGAAVGIAAFGSLFLFGQEMSTYGIVVAVLLALLLPRYLEKAWRRKLNTARFAMLGAMVVFMIVMVLVFGFQTGFTFKPPQ